MLRLIDIKKDYVMSDDTVNALKGVSVNFRRSEFVAILGPSGCGKTTLLNIIGGLDRYSDGDLIIDGKSTKRFKDGDWDTYRNHSIGFVFQSYNLIPHISVLSNVELALTISGVSKQERRKRAYQVLEKVGLKGKEKKKPNQLSGGQMQRVAIARALINNPEIVLADEPTGALDSETSLQIMDLLKDVSKDRLVIMVTHNPDLATKYSTRIINMSDGVLTHDSNHYDGKDETIEQTEQNNNFDNKKGKKKRAAMSFWTALSLSFNNLMTKKARTFLISFAGSIGIIGITLILSLSFGFDQYIKGIQVNSMSTYPLVINKESYSDPTSFLFGGSSSHDGMEKYPESDEIYENSTMTDLFSELVKKQHNDTATFKKYIEQEEIAKRLKEITNDVQYTYSTPLNIFANYDFNQQKVDHPIRLAPISDDHHDSYIYQANQYRTKSGEPLTAVEDKIYQEAFNMVVGDLTTLMSFGGGNPFGTLMNNQPLLEEQFDVLQGHLPTNINEVVIKINSYNEISDLFLYGIGLKDMSYMVSQFIYQNVSLLPEPAEDPKFSASFDDLMNLSFTLLLDTQTYQKVYDDSSLGYHYVNTYKGVDYNQENLLNILNNSLQLKVVGIIRPKPGVTSDSFSGAIGYHPDLYKYVVEQTINPSDELYKNATVVHDQLANEEYNVLTGELFNEEAGESLNDNLNHLGYVDYSSPDEILIYPSSFENKNKVLDLIDEYNQQVADSKKITVNDSVGTMLDSVQIIIDSVSYVLIAFVSISLLVSSIMIGIITYVSVLERTKEIGVLRSIGARKKDISRVFNAETLIIGLVAGLLGIGIASLINIPIMLIINYLTQVGLQVVVPWYGAVFLPLISVMLTMIAGLIPSSIAAKKDPVIALRME